jgi:hypothetical protein
MAPHTPPGRAVVDRPPVFPQPKGALDRRPLQPTSAKANFIPSSLEEAAAPVREDDER